MFAKIKGIFKDAFSGDKFLNGLKWLFTTVKKKTLGLLSRLLSTSLKDREWRSILFTASVLAVFCLVDLFFNGRDSAKKYASTVVGSVVGFFAHESVGIGISIFAAFQTDDEEETA